MSSLAERLAAASRDRVSTTDSEAEAGRQSGRPGKKSSTPDLFRDLKTKVHNRLVTQLGPKLYDANLSQPELERMVRGALQEAMGEEEAILTAADRTRIAQEISDDILGYGPIEPFLRDPDLTEVMVNGCDNIWIERSGRLHKVEGGFNDEAHLRRTIDKIVVPHRPSRRRVEPDGGRPPPRRQPCQRRHPATGDRRLTADHP